RDWPDATLLRLEQNYRSTKRILSAANSVIANNSERLEKSLWTDNQDGPLVAYSEALDERDEVRQITGKISLLTGRASGERAHEGYSYKSFAVFYRTNAQSRVFEEHFIREGIPYTVVGGFRFYDRKEVRDALALLKSLANPDDVISLRRIINTPPRGIGAVTFDKIIELARELQVPVLYVLPEALKRGLLKKPPARKFVEAIEAFRADFENLPLHELTQRLLEDTGYLGMLVEEGTEEALERAENLHELISAIKDFEEAVEEPSLATFLDHVALISDVDSFEDSFDRVTLMTLHSAKGLEFPVVFMAGMEEGLFPHSRSIGSSEEIEEERRLCYVGMTRAMHRLYLFSSGSRTIYGETRFQTSSRFIDEISPEFLESSVSKRDPDEHYYTLDESQLADIEGEERSTDESYSLDDDEIVVPDMDASVVRWAVGMRVRHPSFGSGVIRATEGVGEDAKLTINFSKAGPKKLVVKYANLSF
ncbi:MAG: 3'-5' exonuclease, partial [Thermodesulfobacteriota bacterium]